MNKKESDSKAVLGARGFWTDELEEEMAFKRGKRLSMRVYEAQTNH
jgi:hypothetical protein